MHAVRNISLCTKDCLCLYVCPTGATDTETGQIDASKCLDGCRVCVDACPSHAISLVPEVFPAQQEKTDAVKKTLLSLAESKVKQEYIAADIEKRTNTPILRQLAKAFNISNRLMAEDLLRESGYMLPQSQNAQDFLQSLLDTNQPEGFPKEAVERLLEILKKDKNKEDKKMNENKTLDNLMEAFAGEAQANRKYLAYSKKAEKDGNLNAAKLFKAASDAETLHALKHFEVAGKVGSTLDNLKDGVAGETHEYKEMYPDFVKIAEAEGNKAALLSFTYAMKAEEVHAKLYQEALENIDQTEEVFYYLCPVCGNIEKVRPDKCCICGVPGDKFIKY
jgi:rubrerythrin/NAD-dependent dihydropyrimidine dehydrogenase PreA subunit